MVLTRSYRHFSFGRAVITKTGSNELHGSLWANVTPLEATRKGVSVAGSALSHRDSLGLETDFGFDVGGPIIKDHLWFYVGFAPVLNRLNLARITSTRVDRRVNGINYNSATCAKNSDQTCDGDGNPATTSAAGCELNGNCESDGRADVDPSTGFTQFEEIDRSNWVQRADQYQFTGKLSFAVNPDHQGQISVVGLPSSGVANFGVAGTETALQQKVSQVTTDMALKWTSKLNDNKTQIDVVFGWHHDKQEGDSVNATLPGDPSQRTDDLPVSHVVLSDATFSNLGVLGRNRDISESNRTLSFCSDNANTDQFMRIVNCPVSEYWMNSFGAITDNVENRYSGKVTLTQRVKALGHHQFKAGFDFEVNSVNSLRNYTGGEFDQSFGDWEVSKFVHLNDTGNDVCGYNANGTPVRCDYLASQPVHTQTFNWAGFLQDSWSILPNLTINAGLRYEQQRIGYSDAQKNLVDPATMDAIGSKGLALTDLVAPRVGLIYDWTKEGRSKIYANWGRFYESIPLDMSLRSFGGEEQYTTFWDWESQCGGPSTSPLDPALPSLAKGCPRGPGADGSNRPAFGDSLLGGNSAKYGIPSGLTLVTPGLKAQYMDELVVGVEYEVLEDLRVGLSYQNRKLGRVIEDVSPDGGNTFILANPGEFSGGEEQALVSRIMSTPEGDIRDQLISRLQLYRQVRTFDPPSRTYNAVQLTATKRFSKAFFMQGSYTYSALRGNYPGLLAADSGQLDPNISSQYDLAELLSNRYGALPADRPHSAKLDAYYTFDLEKAGRVTTGLRLRGQSGTPITALARHAAYGPRESFLLPRGSEGRTAFESQADLHVAYARKIGDLDLEVFFELFNLLNNQVETAVDQEYSTDVAHPIVGGDDSDLPYAKTVAGTGVRKKLNFGNTTARNAPLTGRIGLTLSF
jgi:outer membrane receptor protein involved in Fe transport